MVHHSFYLVLSILLVGVSQGVLADDLATPSPTPAYYKPLPPGPLRRAEWVDRRRAIAEGSQSHADAAQARAQAKANRHSTAAEREAEAKAAAHARAQAQHQLAAETRHETAKEIPHTNSDLMSRMGFSEEEIAAQKAREQSGKLGAKEKTDGVLGTTPPQSAHSSDTGAGGRFTGQGPRCCGAHAEQRLARTGSGFSLKPMAGGAPKVFASKRPPYNRRHFRKNALANSRRSSSIRP